MADTYNMSDVFLSYSRRDNAFVRRIFGDLKSRGKEVWADFEDIPKAVDWWKEIQAGIDAADAFVFIISPDSVNSDVCRQEIEHALNVGKRFIPVLHRDVTEEADKAKIHPAISSHNWIFFREADNYETAFKTLMESIETDIEHNRTLTRLLVRAKEWDSNGRNASYLLQGEDLIHGESWIASSLNKKPSPTNLHGEYIRASRTGEALRQRRLLGIVSVGMVIALLLAGFAVYQMNAARQARDAAQRAQADAVAARDIAEQTAREARSLALAASASQALANNDPDLALILAREAIRTDDTQPQVRAALADAAYAPGTSERIAIGGVIVNTVVYADNKTEVAAGLSDGHICVYDGTTFESIGCLAREGLETAHDGPVFWIHMNERANRLLSSGDDNRLALWDIALDSPNFGKLIAELQIEGLESSALSHDGLFALFGLNDGRVGYWDIRTNSTTPRYFNRSHTDAVTVIAIRADGQRALSGSERGLMVQWDITTGTGIGGYQQEGNTARIRAVAFSPDGMHAVVGDNETGLLLWNLQTGRLQRTFQGHEEAITAIAFSPDGRSMFTSSWDNSIREWDVVSGSEIRSFYGHTGGINALSLSGDGLNLITGSFDSTLRIWRVRSFVEDRQITSNNQRIRNADWGHGLLVTIHEDGEVLAINMVSGRTRKLATHQARGADIRISPDGQNFAAIYSDCYLSYFNHTGQELWSEVLEVTPQCNQLLFHEQSGRLLIVSPTELTWIDPQNGHIIGTIPYASERTPRFFVAEFTPDGTAVAIGENYLSEQLYLLDIETGEIIKWFEGHSDGILSIDFDDAGTRMVTGSFDTDVRVWDVETTFTTHLFEGHSDRVTAVRFTPSQDTIASASNDRTMRIWDLETGFEVYDYRGHTDRITRILFSDGGDRILTSSFDSTLLLWRPIQPIAELQTWIEENRYIRDLTCAERKFYFDRTLDCNSEQ